MPSKQLTSSDFDFTIEFNEETGIATVTELTVNEKYDGKGYDHIILETLRRISLWRDNIDSFQNNRYTNFEEERWCDVDAFQFMLYYEENKAYVSHLEVDKDIRGEGYGSVILETIKRVALQRDGITDFIVMIGGGESTESFLKKNGFKITNRRKYDSPDGESVAGPEGEYGVDAIFTG